MLWLILPAAATAQTLTSNRPGIGDSEALVPRGAIQIESGVAASKAPPRVGRRWTQTFGELNFRAGLRDRIELFAGWDGLSIDRVEHGTTSKINRGTNDLRVGAKLAVFDEAHHHITLAIAPAWSFPVGAAEFSSGTNDGSLRLLWARSMPRGWSLSGNLLFDRTSDDAGRYWGNDATAGVTKSLSDSVSVFAEVATQVIAERPDTWTADAGIAWIARRNLQWDVSAGRGFVNRGEQWFVSGGVTVRAR